MSVRKISPWLATLCAGLVLGACSKNDTTSAPPAPSAPAALPAEAAPAPAAVATSVMAQLFTLDVLGMNLAYVEKLAGPAMRSHLHQHTFRAEGCEFTLTTDANDKAVQDMEVQITPSCNLPLEPLLGSFAGPAQHLQDLDFGTLQHALGGMFYADCLTLCGNAYDPSVYMHTEGPRALGFVEFQLSAQLVDDATLEAAHHWAQSMQAGDSEDYVIDTRFNCEPQKYNEVASKAFALVRPHRLRFGHDLGTDRQDSSCQKS